MVGDPDGLLHPVRRHRGDLDRRHRHPARQPVPAVLRRPRAAARGPAGLPARAHARLAGVLARDAGRARLPRRAAVSAHPAGRYLRVRDRPRRRLGRPARAHAARAGIGQPLAIGLPGGRAGALPERLDLPAPARRQPGVRRRDARAGRAERGRGADRPRLGPARAGHPVEHQDRAIRDHGRRAGGWPAPHQRHLHRDLGLLRVLAAAVRVLAEPLAARLSAPAERRARAGQLRAADAVDLDYRLRGAGRLPGGVRAEPQRRGRPGQPAPQAVADRAGGGGHGAAGRRAGRDRFARDPGGVRPAVRRAVRQARQRFGRRAQRLEPAGTAQLRGDRRDRRGPGQFARLELPAGAARQSRAGRAGDLRGLPVLHGGAPARRGHHARRRGGGLRRGRRARRAACNGAIAVGEPHDMRDVPRRAAGLVALPPGYRPRAGGRP